MTEETVSAEVEAAVVESAEVAAPKARTKKAAEATAKYTVIGGAIAPNGGSRDDLIHPGSVVELTAEKAKHYNALGYLKPYIED